MHHSSSAPYFFTQLSVTLFVTAREIHNSHNSRQLTQFLLLLKISPLLTIFFLKFYICSENVFQTVHLNLFCSDTLLPADNAAHLVNIRIVMRRTKHMVILWYDRVVMSSYCIVSSYCHTHPIHSAHPPLGSSRPKGDVRPTPVLNSL